jgi:hypothetical protein
MSTNALIALDNNDGAYSTVYLHWDGYPSHALYTLKSFYSDIDKVKKLIQLGDIHSLSPFIEPDESVTHSWDDPSPSVTLFYGRDQHETATKVQARHSPSMEHLKQVSQLYAFTYLFTNNEWIQL